MVDKNSKLADDFITGLKNSPNVYAQTFSKFFVEPTLGLMVPGSNEEERQQIKSDIADKNAIINEFQNNPAFVEEMQRINSLIPQKRGPEIAKLFNRYEALGMPTKTKMELLNQFREFFFGDSYDIHAAVASGEKGITDFRSPKEFVDYVFGILDVVDAAGLSTLAARGLSKGTQTLLQGLNKKIQYPVSGYIYISICPPVPDHGGGQKQNPCKPCYSCQPNCQPQILNLIKSIT